MIDVLILLGQVPKRQGKELRGRTTGPKGKHPIAPIQALIDILIYSSVEMFHAIKKRAG